MRYLTKSRFSTAVQCPTKLRYCDDRRYANANHSNDFLMALADGGHQVGALAKCLFPDGIEIDATGHDAQVAQTASVLSRNPVSVFEAAVRVDRLFIRADLLRREGNRLDLFEVKSKGVDPSDLEIIGKRGGFQAGMKPYLYDVAFQRHVLRKAFPEFEVRSHLVMVNKAAIADQPRVAQRLRITRINGRVRIETDDSLRDGVIARALLHTIPLDEFLDQLEKEPLALGGWEFEFSEGISELASRLDGEPLGERLGNHCKKCEFRASADEKAAGLLDGRMECLQKAKRIKADQLTAGTVLDLYQYRSVDRLLDAGKILLTDLEPEDVGLSKKADELSSSHRQWLQAEEANGVQTTPFLMSESLRKDFSSLTYPLHFVDFETSRSALPFHQGNSPYHQLLFQFSHHQVNNDGSVKHQSQFLADASDPRPSLSTVRMLRQSLGSDDGTVVHWWDHERTVLNEVRTEISRSSEDAIPDRDALIQFLDDLLGTTAKKGRLFDLGRAIHRTAFFPGTRGSSSLKRVLPAVLSQSKNLQEVYSAPIYGTETIPSLNFANHAWVKFDENNEVMDPYALLSERIDDPDLVGLERLEDEGTTIANGGAAMVAYSLMQNIALDDATVQKTRAQLLRYCELDTFAMVLAWEAINELIKS